MAKRIKDENGKSLTKFDMVSIMYNNYKNKKRNYDKYLVYYIYCDNFTYEEIAGYYMEYLKLDNILN